MAELDIVERVRALLEDCAAMTLATNGPDGLWAADVFFAPRGLTELFFLSSPNSRHSRNVLASPQAAATIHVEIGQDWRAIRGLQLTGSVGLVPEAGLAAASEAYFDKFPFAARLVKPESEVGDKTSGTRFFVFQVERLYLVDNRLGFGVRREVELSGR